MKYFPLAVIFLAGCATVEVHPDYLENMCKTGQEDKCLTCLETKVIAQGLYGDHIQCPILGRR